MSADGGTTLTWGDGEHRFRLAIGQLSELQQAINKPRIAMGAPLIGPFELLRLLETGNVWPNELREIIRLALIGGGMAPLEALTMVKRYVEDRPLFENVLPAYQILEQALVGDPGDPVGKKAKVETTEPADPSSSPPSTDSAVH